MKKIVVIMCYLLCLTGCDMFKNINNTPVRKVEDFLAMYQNVDNQVLDDLEEIMKSENILDEDQKKEYKKVMKKHYQNLTYEIKDEKIDGDSAVVTVEIEVFDYSKVLTEANNHLQSYPEEFQNENGDYDAKKFNDYRIDKIKDVKDKITYTLDLNLTKKDNEWTLDKLSTSELDKINGTYTH